MLDETICTCVELNTSESGRGVPDDRLLGGCIDRHWAGRVEGVNSGKSLNGDGDGLGDILISTGDDLTANIGFGFEISIDVV